MLKLSAGEWVVLVVLSFVWAWFGYRLSESDRKTLGRTPWGLPSAVWALFWFLSLVVGLVLYLIAHSVGVRRAHQQGVVPGLGMPATMARTERAPRAPTVAEQFPAYPRPANGVTPPGSEDTPSPQATAPHPDAAPPFDPASVSPPAWHPDPSGRFHYRWWDGREWTSQVATDGHHLIDTNPDQRIGPYRH